MDIDSIMIYEPDLGLEGTLSELTNWANRYTSDYSDEALARISELNKIYGREEKDIQIPMLLIDERKREYAEDDTMPYERMKIDQFIFGNIGYSESKGDGTEIEIRSEDGKVLISILGVDDVGTYSAAGAYSMEEFMQGEHDWLEKAVGSILFYSKEYLEE